MPLLTARQTQVVQLALAGKSQREIAKIVGIDRKTVGVHVYNAKKRLGVKGGLLKLSLHPYCRGMGK